MSNGPETAGASRPRLKAPPGSCDTHLHIFGPEDRYPIRSEKAFPPPPNSYLEDYRAAQKELGLTRAVIVQPAAYGADNRCTLAAMEALGDDARGIAVVTPDVSDEELTRLTDAGICGLRLFMLPGGSLGWDVFEEMAARVHDFGWHIQLQMDGRLLHEREQLLSRIPTTIVIDHVGKFLEPVEPDHPGFQTLLRLVDDGRCWVKLSAPYETSKIGPPLFDDVGKLAKVLVRAAPERMVWASNWPHPSAPADAKPDDAMLLDLLLDWADDDTTRRRILVDNPAELYGFNGS